MTEKINTKRKSAKFAAVDKPFELLDQIAHCKPVAANPYVAHLGPPRTASSRLNLAQAFNSFGTFLALAGIYCAFLGGPTVQWYLGFFR